MKPMREFLSGREALGLAQGLTMLELIIGRDVVAAAADD